MTDLNDSSSDTDIGFHICGGADYSLSDTMTAFGEVKYSLNGIDTFAINVGVKFAMGQ